MSQPATAAPAGEKAIRSDPALLAEIRRYGGFDTSGCYQCGTCTLVCDEVYESVAFPRRIIRCGLLGLRSSVDTSLDPWLCHDCGTCSTGCPRQADPRRSMQTLRHYLVGRYEWTGLAARIMRSRWWYFGALIFMALLTLALIVVYHLWEVEMSLNDLLASRRGPAHMFPTMTYFTYIVVLLPLLFLLSNAFRMWWITMGGIRIPPRHYLAELGTYFVQSVTHEKMRKCPEKARWPKHWMLALGMVAKLVIIVFFLSWFQTGKIYPVTHPQRWVGYLVTALLLYGVADILIGRLRGKKEIYKHSEWRDYVFPVLLLVVVLSGLAAHVFRYAGASYKDDALRFTAHYAYIVHIVTAVPMLVVEIPFGKWSHMIYRPLALYLQAVEDRAAASAVRAAGKAVSEHA